MMRRAKRLSWALFAFGIIFVGLGAAQQEGNVKSYFELGQLGDIPGDIQVSTDYLTIIEFEGHGVEDARSARPDLFTIQASENVITIRANEAVISTDVYARVAGQTVLFRLESNEQATGPRRYVVRDTPEVQRSIQPFSGASGATRPPATADAPLFPQGLLFEADFFRPRQSEIVIQYRLINESQHPIVNDPYRLRIYYGDTSVPYEIERSPAPGRPNYLAPGESEFGQLVVPQAPTDLGALELEWMLTEVGPGAEHKLIRNFADLADVGSAAPPAPEAASAEPIDAKPIDAEPIDNEADAVASEASATPPSPQPAPEQDAEETTEQPAEQDAAPEPSQEAALSGVSDDAATTEAADIEAAPGQPFIDSSFDKKGGDWYVWLAPDSGAEASGSVVDGEYCVDTRKAGSERWHVRFALGGLALPNNQTYILRYDAYSDADSDLELSVGLIRDTSPYTDYVWKDVTLTAERTTFEHRLRLEKDENGDDLLLFTLGSETPDEAPYRTCFDNIQLLADSSVEQVSNQETQTEETQGQETQGQETQGQKTQGQETQGEEEVQASAAPVRLLSSSFEETDEGWDLSASQGAEASGEVVQGEYCITIQEPGDNNWQVGLRMFDIALQAGQSYELSWRTRAEHPVILETFVSKAQEPWDTYAFWDTPVASAPTESRHSFTAEVTNDTARLEFLLGGNNSAGELPTRVCLDDVELVALGGEVAETQASQDASAARAEAGEPLAQASLVQSDFEAGIEDTWKFYTQNSAEAVVEHRNGEACFRVTQAGKQAFNIGFLQLDHALEAGLGYTLNFDAYADRAVSINSSVGFQEDPWTGYHEQPETLEPEKRSYAYTFVAPEDQSQARVLFNLGGEANAALAPYELCLDNVYLGAVTNQ